jgi:hypothetical protein
MERFHGSLDFRLVGVIPPYVPLPRSYDMAGKRIAVVAGDRGGWNALEPVLLKALDAGCSVTVMLAATCANQYKVGTLRLDQRCAVAVVEGRGWTEVENFGREAQDLLVIGASQSGEGTMAGRWAMEEASVPVLTVQDMYGSSLPLLQELDRARELGKVQCVCVADEFAREQLLTYCAALINRIVVTGGPQFDKVVEQKKTWAERRRQLRQAMNIDEGNLLFLIVGQLNGTAESIALVQRAMERLSLDKPDHLIVRPHPRATWLDQALLEYAEESLVNDWFKKIDSTLAATSEDLLPAVDFVLSGYSTTNYFSILFEMPGVVYVGTPSYRWDLYREKGLMKPPEVQAGAAWYVEDPEDLIHVIQEVHKGDASDELRQIKEAQRRMAQYNDGHAADRIWTEMQKLLG